MAEEEKYLVRLDNFEGPLDLLLHLLESNKMDIYDIPIADITKQYLAYLDAAEEMNLEIASEFLVMAAHLISIKVKMLLPKPPKAEEEAEDPREELTRRLLEYKFYKEASLELKDAAANMQNYGFKEIDIAGLSKNFSVDNPVANVPLDALWQAFSKVLQHVEEEKPELVLSRESYEIEAMMDLITESLAKEPMVEFGAFFTPPYSKRKVISVFLALLELYKMGALLIRQDENFGSLWLIKAEPEEAADAI